MNNICPICQFHGEFNTVEKPYSCRKFAECPKCNSHERHRLQYLVINKLAKSKKFYKKNILHFAPESFFREIFKRLFSVYVSTDVNIMDVDVKSNIIDLPFRDDSVDFIFVSHVLEHIQKDDLALLEIKRILKPRGGIAVIGVPIISKATIEYQKPIVQESGHVRAPGLDYITKMSKYFTSYDLYKSSDFELDFQLYVFEDRTVWPNNSAPYREPTPGEKHLEFVSVFHL